MRVVVAGDTHADSLWVQELCRLARENDIDTILQLGDFGYFPHLNWGRRFLSSVKRSTQKYGVTIVWIDGNHENHAILRKIRPNDDGFVAVYNPYSSDRSTASAILHAPRGLRWEWDGVSFLALGGAYSIDKGNRTEGRSWWPQELITEAEIIRACEGGSVDVLVSHDAPTGVEGLLPGGCKDMFPESRSNRLAVRAVFDEVKPKIVIHGHYHVRNSYTLAGVPVEGYAHNEYADWNAWGILDLDLVKERRP